ncbi:INO80 complex subunit D-B [Trichomycterus rosablanca]|uniref:INO80 complex subunit D-B n=1 Tax=Trichomycterus rosablanca TaxID=2290929 RepID=UPI002F3591AC
MYEGKHIHYSEVDRKPLCSYSPKLCKQRRLNGYAFCIRHVLEDQSAPFRQCEYVAKYNSQRCTNPIPKTQDRKFCNSHLQVMGVLPKKERKKKQDTLESLALNITVPSLALKAPNNLGHLPLPSPSSLASLLPLDPYSFIKVDKGGVKKEGPSPGKKALNCPAQNQKQKTKGHAVSSALSQHFSFHPLCPSKQTVAPSKQTQALSPSKPPLTPTSTHIKPASQTLCMRTPVPVSHQTLIRPTTTTNLNPKTKHEQCTEPNPSKKDVPTTPGRSAYGKRMAGNPACLVELNRLMEEQRRSQEDLRLDFDLDWSEDSGEERESQVERLASSQYRSLLEKWHGKSASESSTRGERLAGLCSYLRLRHRYLCKEERSLRRERKSHHSVRKALLQAATRYPDATARLIQECHPQISASSSSADSKASSSNSGLCVAQIDGENCTNHSLPFTRHCFKHILQSRSQQLFSSCTARFADGAQCSVPVFDITHQTPLCEEHAKKMDNFLRGDVSRRTYHHQQQLQQRRRLKKAKLPTISKKHKKKGSKSAVRQPKKPVPPAEPQGNLCLPTQPTGIRSPLTPDLSADELPDDLTSDISDIPHDLELNQEDFSDVLSRFPDDLQDFDLFEGKSSELLPTSEEAEELVRVLQDMGTYPESLACLSSMVELGPVEGSDCRGMEGGVIDLLGTPLSAETLSNLELDPSLLPITDDAFSPSPNSSSFSQISMRDSTHSQRPQLAHTDDPKDELDDISHGSWGVLALPLSDSTQLHSLIGSEGLLMSTSLSTPPTPMPTAPCQPTTTLSALPESSLTIPITSSASSPRADFWLSGQLKHTLPSLFSHCGIPADLQPHHSTPAPTMDQT